MRHHLQALGRQPNSTARPRAARFLRMPASWARGLESIRSLFILGSNRVSVRARIGVVAAGLAYTSLLGAVCQVVPNGVNFDCLYLFGCALAGWLAGGGPALFLVLASVAIQYHHESLVGAPVLAGGMIYWNCGIRLLAYGGIAWLAGEAGRLARNLEQRVEERTIRLRSEVAQHQHTAELLSEAIELFRQVTENIADVFWVTDATKSQVEYISPGFEQIWGKCCEELQASPTLWQQGIHPEDRERVTRAMFRKQPRGDYDEEYRVVRPDGALRWVHDRAFPVKDENGAVYRIVGIAEDITERKRAEQLLQAERDLGAALSATSDLKEAVERVLDIAMQLEGINCGGLYLMNPRTGELHLEAHRGLPGSFVERIAHYKADATEAGLARAGRITYVGHEQIPRSLEALWGSQGLRALAVVPLQHKGTVLGILNLASFSEDEIPPRLRLGIELIASQVAAAFARIGAEEASRRSEAQLRTIINGAPIALLAFDANGIVTFEDGQALSVMGIKPSEHLGRPAAEVYSDFPLMLENLRRSLKAEEFNSIVQFGDHVLDCRFSPVRIPGSRSECFVAVATNITERFRLEHQILEISDREQARIGQDVHDGLCQQLVGAAFAANSLQQALASQERAETNQAQRICALLDDAITESRRVARGLYPVRLETEGLGPALTELAALASERFGVRCGCETGPDVQCGTTTATHLYRIAQEAVNNAMKHSGARNLLVRLNCSKSGIELEIKDDGKGMGSAAPPRAHCGMGLHIMDYRARSLGGTLSIETDGRGTRVSCHVPQRAHEPKPATR